MSNGKDDKTYTSLQALAEAKGGNSNPGNNRNNRETCPGCGNRTRYPEHPLCPGCNTKYIEEVAKLAVAEDESTPILNRLEWAREKGKATLQRLEEEHATAVEKEREEQQPYWDQAHQKIQENLSKREVNRIDREAFNKAKGMVFGKLWNADPEHTALSKRRYGLSKAIESLGNLLSQLEEKLSSEKEDSEESEE